MTQHDECTLPRCRQIISARLALRWAAWRGCKAGSTTTSNTIIPSNAHHYFLRLAEAPPDEGDEDLFRGLLLQLEGDLAVVILASAPLALLGVL
jgi:hypothetical protein